MPAGGGGGGGGVVDVAVVTRRVGRRRLRGTCRPAGQRGTADLGA